MKKYKVMHPLWIHNSMMIQQKALKNSIPFFIEGDNSGFHYNDNDLFLKPSEISTCFWKQDEDFSLILRFFFSL